MPQQNFENDNIKTRIVDGRQEIFDYLRGKYVAMTPEENVRQMFVRHLIDGKRYPAGLMGNEIAINQNGRERRCDTVVFDRRGCPLMIVEYKAPSVKITQEVFNQIYRYNTVLRVKYLTVCNAGSFSVAVSTTMPTRRCFLKTCLAMTTCSRRQFV